MRHDIRRAELIGRRVEVAGHAGTIVDETQELIVVEATDGTRRRFVKKQHRLTIDGQDIEGTTLTMRPHERIKVKP